MPEFLSYFQDVHSMYFSPAGVWSWNEETGKYPTTATSAKRIDDAPWDNYPDDNMGKIKLRGEIVVLDLDSLSDKPVVSANQITIPGLNLTLPMSLYTTTTRPDKYHIYYRATDDQRKRIGSKMIKGLNGLNIDILQNYNCFEWHSFSPHNTLHKGEILPLPKELEEAIAKYVNDKQLQLTSVGTMTPHSNRSRRYLVDLALKNEIEEGTTEYNHFIRAIVPKEYIPKNKRKLTWNLFSFDYDFVNKMAVKLACTNELGYYEHLMPVLELVASKFNKSLDSEIAKQKLRLILPSLPAHDPIEEYHWTKDLREFDQQVREQPSRYAMFKTIHRDKRVFLAINKATLEPVKFNDTYIFEQKWAEDLAPEYYNIKEDGSRGTYSTERFPVVLTDSNAYAPSIQIDQDTELYRINLSVKSKYIKEAEPKEIVNYNNFLFNIINSTVHPDYNSLILYWMASILFHDVPPLMIPWMATKDGTLGGTGKSMITITIMDKLLDRQVTTAKLSDIKAGWKIDDGLRLMSFEEGEVANKKDWQLLHNYLKTSTSGNRQHGNSKYGATANDKVLLALSGSSNSIPPIPNSDRRILCLEPAQLDGYTDPISKEDAARGSEFEKNFLKYEDELQELANHLNYLYTIGIPEEHKISLWTMAPATIYRDSWIIDSTTNTRATYYSIDNPEEFWSLIKWGRVAKQSRDFVDLMQYFLGQYNSKLQKIGLCWQWFGRILYYIKSIEDEEEPTKKEVLKGLAGPKFGQTTGWAKEFHKRNKITKERGWHVQLEVIALSEASFIRYQQLTEEVIERYEPSDIQV